MASSCCLRKVPRTLHTQEETKRAVEAQELEIKRANDLAMALAQQRACPQTALTWTLSPYFLPHMLCLRML